MKNKKWIAFGGVLTFLISAITAFGGIKVDSPSGGDGDITSVTAGDGISGGGESGDVTITLDTSAANTWTGHQTFTSSVTVSGTESTISSTQTKISLIVDSSTWTIYTSSITDPSANLVQTEGTSNTKRQFFPAASWVPAVTDGAEVLAQIETSTNKVVFECLSLSSSTTSYAILNYSPSTSWDAGTITFDVVWTSTAGTSGGVSWKLQAVALANDDALDTAYGTAIEVTDDLITASDVHKTGASTAVTIGNTPAAGDFISWRIYRDVADTDDDLDGTADLIGVWISWTETGFDDD